MSDDYLQHDFEYMLDGWRAMQQEVVRLRKYEKLVKFIASDYWELSHDKIRWLYTEYKERCRKLIEEDTLNKPEITNE